MLSTRRAICTFGFLTAFVLTHSSSLEAGPAGSGSTSPSTTNQDLLYDYEVYYEQVTEKYSVLIYDDTYSTTYEFDTQAEANAFAEYASSYLDYNVWVFPTYDVQWILYDTYDTSLSANAVATWLSGWGLNTKVVKVSIFSFSTTPGR